MKITLQPGEELHITFEGKGHTASIKFASDGGGITMAADAEQGVHFDFHDPPRNPYREGECPFCYQTMPETIKDKE